MQLISRYSKVDWLIIYPINTYTKCNFDVSFGNKPTDGILKPCQITVRYVHGYVRCIVNSSEFFLRICIVNSSIDFKIYFKRNWKEIYDGSLALNIHLKSVSRNMNNTKLEDHVRKYNSTYYTMVKMQPTVIKIWRLTLSIFAKEAKS